MGTIHNLPMPLMLPDFLHESLDEMMELGILDENKAVEAVSYIIYFFVKARAANIKDVENLINLNVNAMKNAGHWDDEIVENLKKTLRNIK